MSHTLKSNSLSTISFPIYVRGLQPQSGTHPKKRIKSNSPTPDDVDKSTIIDEKSGVLKAVPGATTNLLTASTALATHRAVIGNTSEALPILLSVLRARRTAPISFSPPPHPPATAKEWAESRPDARPFRFSWLGLANAKICGGFVGHCTSRPTIRSSPHHDWFLPSDYETPTCHLAWLFWTVQEALLQPLGVCRRTCNRLPRLCNVQRGGFIRRSRIDKEDASFC